MQVERLFTSSIVKKVAASGTLPGLRAFVTIIKESKYIHGTQRN